VATEVWVLGRREYCLLWSKQRELEGRLVRPMPDYAITAEHFGLDRTKPVPEAVDYYTMQGKKGRTAFIMGVRANESMLRYRSCVQKLHENYITSPYKLNRNIPLRFVKPIYDWTTDDVLKFVSEEHGASYCEYYDLAALVGGNTRVGVPLHSVASRRLKDVVDTEPEFYDRLVECFPHIDAQRRLWKDFDIEGLILGYSRAGWDGVRQCISDNMLTPGLKKRAMSYAASFRKKNALDPRAYPIHSLVRTLLLNDFHSTAINPVGPKTKAYTLMEADEL
jgi:hypothetical protein